MSQIVSAKTTDLESLCNLHSHIREGEEIMRALIDDNIEGGADVLLAMPNTNAGLTTCEQVLEYNQQAMSLVPPGHSMHFIPTLFLTELTPQTEIVKCAREGIKDAKIYPRYRTTKLNNGVRNYYKMIPKIRLCGELGIKIHLHPEHPWMTFINRDAEFTFLPIVDMCMSETEATIVWEHGTDARCIPFWKEMAETGRFFVTLTAHHLFSNEDLAFGNVREVCKPPIKTELDRLALIQLVKDGHNWVMAGGDDAPHDIKGKHVHEGNCACGASTGKFLLLYYAHALDSLLQSGEVGWNIFINFTSRNGRKLHDLPRASKTIQLVHKDFLIPKSYPVGSWTVEPPLAGQKIKYSFA